LARLPAFGERVGRELPITPSIIAPLRGDIGSSSSERSSIAERRRSYNTHNVMKQQQQQQQQQNKYQVVAT
jgi:hypothetical protein